MGKKSRRRAAAGGAVGRGGSGGGGRRSGASSGIGNRNPPSSTAVPTMNLVSIADFPLVHKLEVPSLTECVTGVSEHGLVRTVIPPFSLTDIECFNEDPSRCAHCSVKFDVGYGAIQDTTRMLISCGSKVCTTCYGQYIASYGVPHSDQFELLKLRAKAGVPWAQMAQAVVMGGITPAACSQRPPALKLLKKAADAGHPQANSMLADACRMGGSPGNYCKRDLALAREYTERAMVLDPNNYRNKGKNDLQEIIYEHIEEGNESEAFSIMSLYDGALYYICQADALYGASGICSDPIREANLRRRALRLAANEATSIRRLYSLCEIDEFWRPLASKVEAASKMRLSELQGPSRVTLQTDPLSSFDSSYLTSVGGNFCDCCGNPLLEGGVTVLRKCSRCRLAFYCSHDCQATAWENGHKACCFQHGRIKPDALYVTQGLTGDAARLNGKVVKVVGKTPDSWQVRIGGQLHIVSSKNLRHARPCA